MKFMSGLAFALYSFDLLYKQMSQSTLFYTVYSMASHTRDGISLPSAFASGDEDHIVLAGVDIVVFQDKEFVDSVLLKLCDLDDEPNGAYQAAIEDEVFLAANLQR